MKLKLIKTLGLFFTCFTLLSQSFIEKQLPEPENLSSFFIGPLSKSTIHYGAKPSNFNGEVILFNHGYIDFNHLFFTNNTFYKEAFKDGYQVVFVSTTRGEGIWANGKLLAESLDIITNKYNVDDIYIIAHSNGGKAAEAAMYAYKKKNKVKRVFALGTPYWGTYLADISQQWWFNWIWKATGLNQGSATSTTYYCNDVVRPYFDNNVNNEPQKFYILGASGFASGHTILAPLMLTSGAILYTKQGVNDGVAPYSSTLRPNANYLFKKNEIKLDHVDIALGQHVWEYIKPYLKGYIPKKTSLKKSKSTFNSNKIISDYQIVNSENSYDNIKLDIGNTSAKLNVFHEKRNDVFKLQVKNGKLSEDNKKHKGSKFLNNYITKYTLSNTNNFTELNANSKFVAFVHQPEGPKLIYEIQQKTKNLIVSFDDIDVNINELKVDAIINKTSDLYGNEVKEEPGVYTFNYNSNSKKFILHTSSFNNGIYSIHLTSKHDSFNRSLISGFTIGTISNLKVKELNTPKKTPFDIKLKSNIINNSLEIINNDSNDPITIEVYNLNGQIIIRDIIRKNAPYHIINTSILNKGLYIVRFNQNKKIKSYKIIKQ